MSTRAFLIAGLGLALAAFQAASSEPPIRKLSQPTELSDAPEGERVAVLLAGARVQVLETRGAWTRVVVEGWIPAEARPLDQEPAGEASSPATDRRPTRSPGGAGAGLAGSIFVTAEGGRTFVGARTTVRLIAESEKAEASIDPIRRSCATQRAALEAEARMLAERAERAMQTIESTSRAFEAHDDAKRERARKLREMQSFDEECAARIEAVLEQHTAARALSTADGTFALAGVPPGRYLLHASFEAEGIRHEWGTQVDLEEGRSKVVDLTNANRARAEAVPVYR